VADGVEVAVELIERELGGGPVTVAGNSLGGWIAVRLALARPDLVSRLVLVDAGGYREQDWDRIEQLVTVTEPADVEPLYGALFQRVPLPLRGIGRRAFFRTYSSPAVQGVHARITEPDAYGDRELATIAQPAALIWGEHDGIFRLAAAERMAEAMPRARLYRLAGAGHAVQWERPREMADAIDDFRGATDPTPAAARHAPA
jgi:pimeloyl-ACP methyl ester carboxylesterase